MKHAPALHMRTATSRSLPLFVLAIAALAIDVNFGTRGGINIGNLVALLGAGMAILLARVSPYWVARPRLTIADGIYLAYLGLVGATAFWSPSPVDTAYQFVLLFSLWLATVFVSQEPVTAFVCYVIHLALIVAMLAFILAIVAPDYAYQYSLLRGQSSEVRGIFSHQLRFGIFLGLAIGFLIIARLNGELRQVLRRSLSFYVYIPVLLVALFLAYARLYTFFIFVSLLITLTLPRTNVGRVLVLLALAGFLFVALQDQGSFFAQLDDAGVDSTLTGRTRIWERTLPIADRTPIWGHGFPSFDSPNFDWMWPSYRPAHPHNSFVQAYFETGLIGLALTILLAAIHLLTMLRHAGAERRFSYGLFIVAATILGSLTGSNYAGKPSTLFVYMLLLFAIESRRGKAVRALPRPQPVPPPVTLERVAT